MVCQKFIFKLHSSRLRKERWKLNLPLEEARRNDEIISIADSQILRWIDELNDIVDADERAKQIKSEIRYIRKQPNSLINKREIRRLYAELDSIQFKPDYMCLIIDKNSDYYRACRGFSINGIKYKRLLGTNGGIKNSTIVFVSERLVEELKRRIDNGRNPNKELVTAKLEAYKALTCSASTPVSMPNGILIVNDVETEFLSDITYLTDECDGEPVMEERQNEKITLDATDGFGVMLPSLAERWSRDLGLDYTASGFNTRFSFEKGMVVAFDFHEFAAKVAHNFFVKDAWGDIVDIRSVELILTTSMVKLWDCYKNCAEYLTNSISNHYSFGISKTAPEELESERNLNYQFIQSYDLADTDIDELIAPTLNEFHDVLVSDWRKAVLFLRGSGLTANNIARMEDDYIKALMIDHRIINDPFVRKTIYQMLRNRINEAKVGVLKVHGNYSIVTGDPFLLCQGIFGLRLTGLLSAGEIYNEYWYRAGVERLACFRAPMTSHSNIRLVRPARSGDAAYWYQYMRTITVFNGWDTATMALNGCDFDGDIVLLTDNSVLVNRLRVTPALMCAQRKAPKCVPVEEDFVKSNIESFGNEIGQTTNWITTMFDVRSQFKPGSQEYETLSYRIRCGQLYQQNVIDKAKGIIAKPMPRYWHDWHAINKIDNPEFRALCRRIVAEKKPYFMRYIYPQLMKQYNAYIKNTNRNSLREFGLTVPELLGLSPESLTDRQREFLAYYSRHMPVGVHDCIMNKICHIFEDNFDNHIRREESAESFDYRIMKSDCEYSPKQFRDIKQLYEAYNKRLQNFSVFRDYERVDEYDSWAALTALNEEFEKECTLVCPDKRVLCNIVLDICYSRSATKWFAWNMCGSEIIHNLLENNGYQISFPALCADGDIRYGGKNFRVETVTLEECE